MIDQFDSWDYYYNLVNSDDHLSKSIKEKAIRSLDILRTNLGENWFNPPKKEHPIYWNLFGLTSIGNLENILRLGNGISILKDTKGFERLFWKLKNNKDFYSTLTEFEIALELHQKGVIELEPEINNKKPDILCRYKNTEFIFEIKSLGRAKNTLKADITVSTLSSHNEIPIHPCGKVLKVMEGEELECVKNEVVKKCNIAIKTNSPQECYIPNKVKFYFVPENVPNRVDLYQNWCDKQEFFDNEIKGQKGGLMYPDDEVFQEKRVLKRLIDIKNEKQLPTNIPSIVVFDSRYFYFWTNKEREDFETFLEPHFKKFPNIIAVILQTGIIGDESKNTMITQIKKGLSMITKYPFGLSRKEILIIMNPESKFDIKSEIIEKLFV